MKGEKKVGVAIIWISTSVLLGGCATFQHGDSPSQWPPVVASQQTLPSVNIEIKGATTSLRARWQQNSVAAFQDSGLFSKVKSRPDAQTDFLVEISVQHTTHGSNAGLRFLSGFTFFLIPSTATDNFDVQMHILDNRKQAVGEYNKQGSAKFWAQTFLLLAAPFKTVDKALDGVCYDTTAAAIEDAVNDGSFERRQQ